MSCYPHFCPCYYLGSYVFFFLRQSLFWLIFCLFRSTLWRAAMEIPILWDFVPIGIFGDDFLKLVFSEPLPG